MAAMSSLMDALPPLLLVARRSSLRSLTNSLMVCNVCYKGCLVAVSCSSLGLNEKYAIFLIEKKILELI